MSNSLISLKETASNMHLHRVIVEVATTEEWYSIIREANALYGSHNWRGQPRAKRRLDLNRWNVKKTIPIWFDVPDPAFATWVSVKHSVIARILATK
jgi:hypothetical protein